MPGRAESEHLLHRAQRRSGPSLRLVRQRTEPVDPWEYDYFGAPAQTEKTVREIADDLYSVAPVDEPGNDDLEPSRSWYVWAAMGMYPVTPGSATWLWPVRCSPTFRWSCRRPPAGDHAPSASPSAPYVHSLTVTGATYPWPPPPALRHGSSQGRDHGVDQPWLPSSIVTTGGPDLRPVLEPGSGLGIRPALAPPSYGTGRLPAVGYSMPSGGTSLHAGTTTTFRLGVNRPLPGRRWCTGVPAPVPPACGLTLVGLVS